MDEGNDILFEVTSPLGHQVRMTRDTWRYIVDLKHFNLRGSLADVQLTLSSPDEIRRSTTDDRTLLYYRVEGLRQFVCAVTRAEGDGAVVASAYRTRKLKIGEVVWPR